MKTPLIAGLALISASVAAQPRHHEVRHREGGRSVGTFTHPQGYAHSQRTYWQNEHHHRIVYDHRGVDVIRGDRFAHHWEHGYRAMHDWHHFYPYAGWAQLWGVASYSVVNGVTCEAADEQTGQLYPVTATGEGAWTDNAINSVLGQALDECAADAGAGACVPAEPACTYH